MATKLSHWVQQRNLMAGIVLSLAILDHTRLFFHFWNTKPDDLTHPDLALFFTRFSAHLFAPATCLLIGIQLYLRGVNRSKSENMWLWICNGIVLIAVEALVNNFLYTFDLHYRTLGLYFVGIMGCSMILLAVLQYLPWKWLMGITILVLAGHHLLDNIQVSGHSTKAVLWYILHQQQHILLGDQLYTVNYTILPWSALLCLGYCLGRYVVAMSPQAIRTRALVAGLILCAAFFVLRSINYYGDSIPWQQQSTEAATLISYFNVTKYPASLDYCCITIGLLLILFSFIGKIPVALSRFFALLGKMPLTVYLSSTFIIHLSAMLVMLFQGRPWQQMIITPSSYTRGSALYGYGFPLIMVYGIWVVMLLLQYLFCCAIDRLRPLREPDSAHYVITEPAA